MKTIWKFPLTTIDYQTIEMPEGAEILTVDTQCGNPCLWARVDSDARLVSRGFAVHETGHPLPESTGEYIGTYQMAQGALIFHVFEAA